VGIGDALAPLDRRVALSLVALAGTARAVGGLADHMLGYLEAMAIAAPGLVLICVLFWTTGHRSRDKWGIPALAGWAIGLLIGVALSAVESPLALPAALAATGGVYATINVFLGNDAGGE
jgi:hypothetical protein